MVLRDLPPGSLLGTHDPLDDHRVELFVIQEYIAGGHSGCLGEFLDLLKEGRVIERRRRTGFSPPWDVSIIQVPDERLDVQRRVRSKRQDSLVLRCLRQLSVVFVELPEGSLQVDAPNEFLVCSQEEGSALAVEFVGRDEELGEWQVEEVGDIDTVRCAVGPDQACCERDPGSRQPSIRPPSPPSPAIRPSPLASLT